MVLCSPKAFLLHALLLLSWGLDVAATFESQSSFTSQERILQGLPVAPEIFTYMGMIAAKNVGLAKVETPFALRFRRTTMPCHGTVSQPTRIRSGTL